MIRVNIDENTLLNLLLDRVEIWTDDTDILELYEIYYQNLIDCGSLDDCDFDINTIVDNDYVNYLVVVSENELSNYDIDLDEDKNTDKIEAYSQRSDLYLVRTY